MKTYSFHNDNYSYFDILKIDNLIIERAKKRSKELIRYEAQNSKEKSNIAIAILNKLTI